MNTLNETLQNIELNFLRKNYAAVGTNASVRKKMTEYTLEDWNNAITSILFDNNSKLSDKALDLVSSLDNLEYIDFNSYSCDYDISLEEYNKLMEKSINVVFNKSFKYSDVEINKIIHRIEYTKLATQRENLLKQIELINTKIYDLGIVEYI
jgi:hypothetical protein